MKELLLICFICFLVIIIPGGAETLNAGGPYTIGDTIVIKGETNFNTDNQVLVEVYPASFGPTRKYEPSMAGGSSKVVPVLQSGKDRFNWSANMSSTGWKPDQYMVRVEMIGKDYRESALFTLTDNEAGEGNKTRSDDLPAGTGKDTRESGIVEQTVIPKMQDQGVNPVSTTPVSVSPTVVGATKPEQTPKSPLSTGIMLISVIVGVFIVRFKKE